MILDHGTKYEENLSNHYGGMCEDGQMDGWTIRPGPLLYSSILLFWYNLSDTFILNLGFPENAKIYEIQYLCYWGWILGMNEKQMSHMI